MTGFLLKHPVKVRPVAFLKEAMAKRTRREKILLTIMIAIGLGAVLLYAVIFPGMTRIGDLRGQVADLTARQGETASALRQTASLQAALREAEALLSSGPGRLNSPMDPETLDTLITGYLTDCKLQPRSLSMTDLVPEKLNGLAEDPGVFAFSYTVDVVALGYRTNLFALLDQVGQEDGVVLTHLQFGTETTGSGEGAAAKGTSGLPGSDQQQIAMTFKIYVLAEGRDARAEFEAGLSGTEFEAGLSGAETGAAAAAPIAAGGPKPGGEETL